MREIHNPHPQNAAKNLQERYNNVTLLEYSVSAVVEEVLG
jgi:hypothetical protein